MSTPFQNLLNNYSLKTKNDIVNAFHEIIQEIALVGLSKSKFFESAAFYGGTSLRILYGLDRFSEDLDFSLLKPNPNFNLQTYLRGVEEELLGFGLNVRIEQKIKQKHSSILSAFLKTNTLETFLLIDISEKEKKKIAINEQLKIKFEVDTDPPQDFDTEMKFLLSPIPFSIRSFTLPSLFAGKMHALLFREWKIRIKGRDWYDFIWFVSKQVPLNLKHLELRMRQSKHWNELNSLTPTILQNILKDKIEKLSIDLAKQDILPFIKDKRKLDAWSKELFLSLIPKISYS